MSQKIATPLHKNSSPDVAELLVACGLHQFPSVFEDRVLSMSLESLQYLLDHGSVVTETAMNNSYRRGDANIIKLLTTNFKKEEV